MQIKNRNKNNTLCYHNHWDEPDDERWLSFIFFTAADTHSVVFVGASSCSCQNVSIGDFHMTTRIPC